MVERPTVLEGLISVRAALQAGSREIEAIFLQKRKRDRDAAELEALARAAQVRVQRVDTDFIEYYAQGKSHGGVVALAGPRRYVSLGELTTGPRPFVAMLDGMEDPFNYGHAVRALYAAGVDGLVVRDRDWTSVAGTIARSSAGASELLPTALAASAMEAAEVLRGLGLGVACAARGRGAVSVYDADLTSPLFLVIGGEKRGISRELIETADLLLEIPYGREFQLSLGMASAATALGFEVMRQRRRSAASGLGRE
jgi:23S rRNA (guanosine2251-2'-O)-methyltransferase